MWAVYLLLMLAFAYIPHLTHQLADRFHDELEEVRR